MKLAIQVAAGLLVVWLYMELFVLPWGNDKESAKRLACLSNTKQQATALLIYASEHDERFPRSSVWMSALAPYTRPESDFFHHPGPNPRIVGYAFNDVLSGEKAPPLSETVPMTYDSTNLGPNAHDRFATLPRPGRHDGKNSVSYADGHARRVVAKAP